jgi:hypothetical protein
MVAVDFTEGEVFTVGEGFMEAGSGAAGFTVEAVSTAAVSRAEDFMAGAFKVEGFTAVRSAAVRFTGE